jgi:hypothetical protein
LLNEKGLTEFTIGIAGIGISFLFDQNLSESGAEDIDYEFITKIRPETKLRVHHDSFPQRSRDIYINYELDKNILSDPLGYPLNQILMILLLSRCKGVMLHACGIDDRGYGYLFLGNSGHGKSTIARLWSENQATVLNDDRIIVREKNGELLMYGTPWPGDFKEVSSKGLPIRKLFFLRHGEKNSVIPKNGAEAVLMLLTRCFPPIWDKKGMEYTMDLCHRIVHKIPCYEFSFEPDRKTVDFVRNI